MNLFENKIEVLRKEQHVYIVRKYRFFIVNLGQFGGMTTWARKIIRIDKAVATVYNNIFVVKGRINKWLLGLTIFIGGRRAIIICVRSGYYNYLKRKL